MPQSNGEYNDVLKSGLTTPYNNSSSDMET
jgi:hypothetical protein